MNILVVGKGGREHALAWKLSQSPRVDKLYVAPGNPGIATLAECVDIRVDTPVSDRGKLTGEIGRLIEFAKDQRIDLTVVGPDDALAGGIVDRFQASGLKIFGPTEAAPDHEALTYHDPQQGDYRRLLLRDGRLEGAVLYGDGAPKPNDAVRAPALRSVDGAAA